ncbi:alpha-2-macroglobulin [Aquimarina sp. BL5]|uniref:alpha-2-macroglobulin family protein n=1 Tax=Aquimarina sp. BL5 TaxID=1714860 RepID=UPI000E529922|nr:MG2 domain-containing protein [Aquimarina sp. BL5]AXT52932.1 alpha-2-macroglobulin [Aquimarina sp. BL5]RKN10344.1 alpha-2-macroglobulin [Aquimarina sp. BL5]
MRKQYFILPLLIFLSFAVNGQYKYDKLWAKIENLEIEGKTRSASKKINQIYSLAKAESNQSQIIKSFLYKVKYTLLLEEDANSNVYQMLLSEVKNTSFPTKNILESILAKSLESYLDSNAYKIRKRTATDTIISTDYRTWDIKKLNKQIHSHFQNSLKQSAELIKIKDTVFSEILKFGDNDQKYRNTLYDLLANRAISFYNANNYYYNKKDSFAIQKDHYSIPSIFISNQIGNDLKYSSIQNALELYQRIEKAHYKRKDSVSLVHASLDRLEFLNSKNDVSDLLYFEALKNLQSQFTGTSRLPILLHLAHYFKNHMSLSSHPDYNEKAIEICNQILETTPNSIIGIEALKLKELITNPSLSITTEKFILPNKKSRAFIEYKDINSIHISFYKVPFTYQSIKDSYYDIDSLITDFTKNHIPAKKTAYALPKNKYHIERSTEIILPALAPGKYIVIARKDPQATFENDIYGINYVQSTSLALISSSSNKKSGYQVVNRHNGSPIENATILLQDNRQESPFFRKLITDKKGSTRINLEKKSHELNTLVSKDSDSLFLETSIDQRYTPYSYRYKGSDDFEAKAKIFTDRSIYRPGQKVYFKGILTQRRKKISSPVSGEYVIVTLYDANEDEIKELRLKTNEFGSIHGEFILPTNRLNGEFTIEIDEDYEEDSDFWENMYDFEIAEHRIKVEEYKRPRFEITFDKIIETYTLNDSIKVKGTAKAFLGSAISKVPVNYTITRETSYQLPFDQEEKVVTGKTNTNLKGDFTIGFIATTDSRATPVLRPVYRYRIDAEITDINGETRNETQYVRVGYHSLEATILMDQKLSSDKTDNKLYASIKNLNNHPIGYEGTVSIYKLKHPDRVLRKRPWSIPDVQQIPKNTFLKLFPNDTYTTEYGEQYDDTNPVETYTVNTKEDDKIPLGDITNWKGGKYIAKFHTKDAFGYDITTEQQFTLANPKEKYLADKQLFDLKINDEQVSAKNILQIELRTAATSLFVNVEAYQKNRIIFNDIVQIIDGQYNIPIRLKQKKDQIDVQVSFIKFNCIWTDQLRYYFPQQIENTDLNIELETFRNKLQPGTDETWKLKILNSTGDAASAEVLASMYDMSLDTFIGHEWRSDIKIHGQESYYYNKLPRIDTHTSFQNISIWMKNLQVKYYRPRNFTYNSINTFGFHFSNPDRGQKNYLRTLSYHPRPSEPKVGKRLKATGGTITGIVTDGLGIPLPGVNVVIKGTTKGTQTDFDGVFTIQANKNDLVIFSYIGFISSEIKVHNNQASVVMREDAAQLEEVVVTAQGIQTTRKSMGYAVSTITTEEINSTYNDILKGKVAGVEVISATGASATIKIRGNSSFKNDNKVLVIVDGVPFLKGQQSLNTLDLADIKMLKGAAAEAIYGSRGVNGVIIITTKKGLEELQKVVPRKNLKETAFFFPQLQTDKKGNVSFSFSSPEALTRWKFQAFAYDKKLNTKLIQSEIVTQKELSIVPNIPRFLREGDTVTISAKIANLDIKKMKGLVSLSLTDEISQNDLKTVFVDNNNVQNFAIDARGNTSIHWKLYIPSSVQAIRYKIVAKAGKFSDGEESIIPVLTNRMLVTESVPMWVRAGEQKTFGFAKMNDQPSATRQNHQVTLEYTTNPAWFAIKSIPYLMEYPYECAEQTFARYYSNEIASHILNSNPKIKEVFDSWKTNEQFVSNLEKNQELKNILIQETPWLRNAQSEKEQQARLAELFDLAKITTKQEAILEKLQGIQDASGGFPWFSGGNVNLYITRHIVSGLGHLKKLQIDTEHIYTSNVIAKKAIAYLDKKYLENYKRELLFDSTYTFSRSDLHYFYARSFWKEKYPTSKKIDSIYKKHIPKEQKKWMQKGLFDKTILALILQRNGDQQIAKNIIKTLEENAVMSKENGMYWKENKSGWYWHQSPIELQALIIEAFSEITGDTETINELKTWLLRNKQLQSWITTKATTEAIYALLLHGSDWLSVEEGADISFGKKLNPEKLLPMNSTEAGTGYIKKQWNTKEITDTMNYVTVQNKSSVPQYGGYYWQYFEDLDNITAPTAHQIMIKKELFLKQNDDEGTVLKKITDQEQLSIGNLITVRVELNVKNNFEFVHMKDMRASGLEPINVISRYKHQDGLGYYESTKDASTNFFFDYLPKGVYVFEYDLRVNNKGDFSNGITTIQSMYAPEFSNHSKGTRIKVE